MRIESYRRYLFGDGYRVVSSSKDWNRHNSGKCTSIKMSLTRSSISNRPMYNNLEELIQLAKSDCFLDNEQAAAMYPEFRKHYAEIMRGELPDWQLSSFRVFYGGIQLYYGNRQDGETGFLWIVGAEHLRLTFETACSRLGFAPTYQVSIDCDENGQSNTQVEEDLGYIRREIVFGLKDPDKKTDLFHSDNQYIDVTEYAGI